ncbi:hypothetical protein EXA21_12425 [Vibrio cincinnatiensis]|uniref:hypothetical protein n=1 Tax=Vibrio cincinnatiensis TaxID=675 RepID=UPI001EDD8688|nr:hypothetical protein [Vibrio cincinnatiensis]MCG3760328.1 hypothetical protein [Vibrio cincinnatiensis]MCG3763652.1 hypothetical protein [Vibrio cincinnatiensis]
MARGYTDIHLKGGSKDGEVISDVPLKQLPKAVAVRSEHYFATSNDGGVGICKGELSKKWHSYSQEVYSKLENQPHKSGTVFQFVEKVMVDRCSATTKSGTQCLHAALHGETMCGTHKS